MLSMILKVTGDSLKAGTRSITSAFQEHSGKRERERERENQKENER